MANYFFTAPNGELIRSSTLLIRDGEGRLSGALCINLDTTGISKLMDHLRCWLPGAKDREQQKEDDPKEHSTHIEDMVNGLIQGIIGTEAPMEMTREERVEKVRFMEEKGIFLMKGSVEKAAEGLGVNKVTIYSYLDEIRRQKQ